MNHSFKFRTRNVKVQIIKVFAEAIFRDSFSMLKRFTVFKFATDLCSQKSRERFEGAGYSVTL